MTGEAGLAYPGHSEAVTPILGKLRLHIQSYVDAEEFHIMPLQDCDVLLGIPWCYRLHAVVDTFHRKITLVHRGKNHVLDVKLKGKSVSIVSASAISSVIKNHLYELLPERSEDHRIDVVPGSSPLNRPPYRVSAAQQKKITSQKKDGSWRMCIDYRALNKSTIKNRFPIRRIDDILDQLQGGSMFSRIDLKSGYHQIHIRPEDVHKTALRTTFGLYEFLVIPFGLANALATFNRMMGRIFRPHINYVGTFFDDMIVFSKSEEEHRDHLTVVFNELRKNRLLINAKKSEFFLEEFTFLDTLFQRAKVEAIKSWPDLKIVHDIRSFLGLCSYYKRFIRHFAEIASPLHALTLKGVTFKWTTKEIIAFKHLKEKLTSDPVVILPDLLKPFVVQCDACGNSLGAVLMQDGRVVVYESRVFCNREKTLQIYEKEMLAVMHALYDWKHFLLGADFIVQTDHQTLRYFLTQAKLSEQHMRWTNFLSMFHFQIVHVEGKKNVVADTFLANHKCLQRLDLPRTPTGNDGIWTIICKLAHFVPSIVSDRDPRMTSLFWKALFENMGTMLKFSSSFHPQTDGQSEEANSIVLDLLKCYVSEHKATWEHYLPLVEYAYNNTVHTSTGKAPFEIVEGGKRVPPILQTKDRIFEADKLWKMKGKERLFPKLGMRYYGLFQVCDKISDVAYRLKLLEGWKIHNAFHVSLLRPFVGDVPEDIVPEEQPEVEELDEILVPEQILAHKDRKVRGKVARRYLVKFKNYSPMNAKWMEEAELVDSPQLLQLYLEAFQLQPTKTMKFIAAIL
ncbi:hypothetical protein L7F22_007805 [Adiantum nelumboides]|nr:hypothetical protein [Adiantum nelumboides]